MSTDLPERDAEGYLIGRDWTEDVQGFGEENISLTTTLDVIKFIRDYYENAVAADARFVIKHLAERMERTHTKLFELFHGYEAGLQDCRHAYTAWVQLRAC
jgi:tRNA 2-thiouridine synthesizing protein E